MPLPSSGPITLEQVQSEFGGANPIGINEYYGRDAGIPASGQISLWHFYGKQKGSQVQIVDGGGDVNSSKDTSWTVPAGVTSVCVVVVGGSRGYNTAVSELRRGGAVLLASNSTLGGAVGGGNGGNGRKNPLVGSASGGGAGGYTGNGGNAAAFDDNGNQIVAATAGSGGGGGGCSYTIGSGGGVGLKGIGGNGAVNGHGSIPPGDIAVGAGDPEYYGGNLRYQNNIAVTPGEVLTFRIAYGGGARVIWGGGRSYPYNAGDL